MWKKFFAASAVASGIIGLLGGGSVFAASAPYAPGTVINPGLVTNVTICVDYSDKVISGESISAEVWGQNVSGRLEFEYENFVAYGPLCVLIPQSTFGMQGFRYIIPMGISGATLSNDGTGEYTLSLEDATVSNKYLRSYGSASRRTNKSVAAINFNANGGSGATPVVTNIEVGSNVVLPKSTLTRTGYKFAGWNTKADGTGTPYADEATIPIAEFGEINLFAQWSPMAVLDSGYTISQKLKRLANPENAATIDWQTSNNNIKAVRMADALPGGFDTSDADNIISTNSSLSPEPIYAWFDDDDKNNDGVGDGVIYLYSSSDTIYAPVTMNYAFYNMRSLGDISGVSGWDTSNTLTMQGVFRGDAFSDVSALADWDTSSVIVMSDLFLNTSSLTDISAIANWDTSNVKCFDYAFAGTGITSVNALKTEQHTGKDYVSWDVSKATDMSYMFNGTPSLSDISALASWDVSSVENMSGMFRSTASLSSVSALASWDVSSVTNMRYLFYFATALTDISGLASWDVSSVTNMGWLFYDAVALVDISALASWNTSSVTDLNYAFASTKITNTNALRTEQHAGKDYVSWDVSKVTDMSRMFSGAESLVNISALASWNTSSVENMEAMFLCAKTLTDISALANWNVLHVTNISFMFQHADSLADISALGNWDTSNIITASNTFSYMPVLVDISALASWNTSNMTNMSGMFASTMITNVDALRTIRHAGKDYVSWDVSNVTDIGGMFSLATDLADISALASWDTSNVRRLYSTFYGASSLTDISPLESWDVSNVTDMTQLFNSIGTSNRPSWFVSFCADHSC